MSVFVYAEATQGSYKKACLEAVSYAKAIATQAGHDLVAITINASADAAILHKYGANQIIDIQAEALKSFSAQAYAQAIAQAYSSGILVLPQSLNAGALAPMLSIQKEAAYISNALALPSSLAPLQVKRKAFSGKAFMQAKSEASNTIISVSGNAFGLKENETAGSHSAQAVSLSNPEQVLGQELASSKLDLKEAEIVVSAGRGLKGPENWGMIEDLATTLGAATACSKPVSDIGWRSHSEHVGQTGKAIAPNLYVAVGISGAIQHLAGVNSSKTIVVVNSDADAPFFKSADYGVVGDAFKIIPELNEKIKAYKAQL
jgi:electron transfer flavoprotein alpha subunit